MLAPQRPLSPRFLLLALPLAALPTMLLFALLATHREELPVNLLLGALAGAFAWILAAAGAMLSRRVQLAILRRHPEQDSALPAAAQAAGALALSLIAAAVALSFSLSPPLGVLAVAGVGLPLPAVLFGLRERRGTAWRFVAVASAALVVAIVAVSFAGPPLTKPTRLVFGPAGADDLVLLSWNLGHPPPTPWPSREGELDRVAAVIRESGAHVVCLQELDADGHLERLLELLGPEWSGGAGPTRFSRTTAVLSRVGGEFFAESAHPLSFGFAAARIARGNSALDVFSVHLGPTRNSALRELEASWLADYGSRNPVPVVIAGDTNLAPEGAWDRLSSLFTDDLEADGRSVALLESVGVDPGREGVSTGLPARRIDRVFVSEAFAVSDYQVLLGKSVGTMDHRPVRVSFGSASVASLSSR